MSQSEKIPEDDIAKIRNPFAKKIKVVASSQPISPKSISPNSVSSNPNSLVLSDSGFYSQTAAVEISSSQLSMCSIDADQVRISCLFVTVLEDYNEYLTTTSLSTSFQITSLKRR